MRTPVHLVILDENAKEIFKLVSQRRYLNVTDENLNTLLHLAIESDYVKLVKLSVEAGVDSINDYKDNSAPHYAVRLNNIDILKILLRANADIKAVNIHNINDLKI